MGSGKYRINAIWMKMYEMVTCHCNGNNEVTIDSKAQSACCNYSSNNKKNMKFYTNSNRLRFRPLNIA